MNVLVCGGRDYTDRPTLVRILDKFASVFVVTNIIEGEAVGADAMARDWARTNGYPVAPYPADWRTYGRRAGAIRNRRMLHEGRPDLVLAFPGGAGTADMVSVARAAGVPVWLMPDEESRVDALGEGVFA